MNEREFVLWLHGFFEISEAKELSEKQVQIIKDHLNLFFKKQTPDRSVTVTVQGNPGVQKPILTDVMRDIQRRYVDETELKKWDNFPPQTIC
jgi:hypothetical protein